MGTTGPRWRAARGEGLPCRSPATQAAFSTWSRATRSASRTQVLQARSTRALDERSWALSSSRGTGYETVKSSNCDDKHLPLFKLKIFCNVMVIALEIG